MHQRSAWRPSSHFPRNSSNAFTASTDTASVRQSATGTLKLKFVLSVIKFASEIANQQLSRHPELISFRFNQTRLSSQIMTISLAQVERVCPSSTASLLTHWVDWSNVDHLISGSGGFTNRFDIWQVSDWNAARNLCWVRHWGPDKDTRLRLQHRHRSTFSWKAMESSTILGCLLRKRKWLVVNSYRRHKVKFYGASISCPRVVFSLSHLRLNAFSVASHTHHSHYTTEMVANTLFCFHFKNLKYFCFVCLFIVVHCRLFGSTIRCHCHCFTQWIFIGTRITHSEGRWNIQFWILSHRLLLFDTFRLAGAPSGRLAITQCDKWNLLDASEQSVKKKRWRDFAINSGPRNFDYALWCVSKTNTNLAERKKKQKLEDSTNHIRFRINPITQMSQCQNAQMECWIDSQKYRKCSVGNWQARPVHGIEMLSFLSSTLDGDCVHCAQERNGGFLSLLHWPKPLSSPVWQIKTFVKYWMRGLFFRVGFPICPFCSSSSSSDSWVRLLLVVFARHQLCAKSIGFWTFRRCEIGMKFISVCSEAVCGIIAVVVYSESLRLT